MHDKILVDGKICNFLMKMNFAIVRQKKNCENQLISKYFTNFQNITIEIKKQKISRGYFILKTTILQNRYTQMILKYSNHQHHHVLSLLSTLLSSFQNNLFISNYFHTVSCIHKLFKTI